MQRYYVRGKESKNKMSLAWKHTQCGNSAFKNPDSTVIFLLKFKIQQSEKPHQIRI